MFYDEDLVADLRFNILNEYVTKFVVVESKYTHSGEKRNLLCPFHLGIIMGDPRIIRS